MSELYFKVKKLCEDAKLPSKREEDAGYDIYSTFKEDFLFLSPGEIFLMPTGISTQFPKNFVFRIVERGSTGTRGIAVRCGVIDSGYRGEIFVPINNTSKKTILFYKTEEKIDEILQNKGILKEEITLYPLSKAIAQGLLIPAYHVEVEEVSKLCENSERKNGIIGSSGK